MTRSRNSTSRSHRSGFSLLEVIAVLTLVGLLAGMAFMSFDMRTMTDVDMQNQLRSTLRYVQARSMAGGTPASWSYGVEIDDQQFTIVRNADTIPVNVPGTDSPTFDAANAAGATSIAWPDIDVYFDWRGRPVDNGGDPLTSDITISGGANVQDITVTQLTGFIP